MDNDEKNEITTYCNKPNPIIMANGKMSPLEMDIITMLITKIDRVKDEYEFYIKDYIRLANKNDTAIYEDIKNACKRLRKRDVVISYDHNGKRYETTTGWITGSTKISGEGRSKVRISIHKDVKACFLELKDKVGYTSIELESTFNLSSVYSKRIYELLKKWQNVKREHTYKVSELRKIFGIENQYKRFYDFEKNVLKKAKQEINGEDSKGNLLPTRPTDMIISYEKIKKGKDIHEIKFTFEIIKSPKKQWKETFKELNGEKVTKIRSRTFLTKAKLDDEQIATLYNIAMEKSNQDEDNAYRFMVMTYAKVIKYEQNTSLFGYYKKALLNNDIH